MKYLIAFLLCWTLSMSFSQSFSSVDDSFIASALEDSQVEKSFLKKDLIAQEVQIYPNPARHTLFIKGYYAHYNLFDDLGRKLISGSTNRIDVSQLPPGMYVVTIHDQNGKYQSKKLQIK